jgi:hypothetical protein
MQHFAQPPLTQSREGDVQPTWQFHPAKNTT